MIKINNFEGKNERVVEIVSGVSAYFLLKKSGNDNRRVFLQLNLCVGKLDSLKYYDRIEIKKYLESDKTFEDGLFEKYYNFSLEFNRLADFINSAEKIRVWSSHLDCDEYCLLLFICNYFPNKNISVVFSDDYSDETPSITALNEEEIIQLSALEHILTKTQIMQYKKEWLKIVKENSELRFMLNGKVKSVSIDYFDEEILARLSYLGEIYIYSFIGDLMCHLINYPDYIYIYLIYRLIDNNLIKKREKNGKIYIATK